MDSRQLQEQCELGQSQLMRMEYLLAERTLAAAESVAWAQRDWDALARLYMPLQEARRQRRQRCGEGVVRLDLLASGPLDDLDANRIVEQSPQGQLLVGGWGSIEPAKAVRRLAEQRNLYLDTFLAAVHPADGGQVVVIVPTEDASLPPAEQNSMDQLRRQLPPHSLIFSPEELPRGADRGDARTFGEIMDIWERLHTPFLAAADAQPDPIQKIIGYRKTIEVDYACELAHQHISDLGRILCQSPPSI